MKRLTCEICGSTDLIKQDGVFVCHECGTKYSVEEAKKLMVEGIAEVTEPVDVQKMDRMDGSDDLNNLHHNDRSIREFANDVNAMKYGETISEIDPNSEEALKGEQYADIADIDIGENYTDLEQKTQENMLKEGGNEGSNLGVALVVVGIVFVVCLLIKWGLG